MRLLLFLGSLLFSLSAALACPPPAGTTVITGPTVCVPGGIANIGPGPHVYTVTSTVSAAGAESHEWSIKGGTILSAIGTPANPSCSRSDRAVTIVEGVGENGLGGCDILSIAQLNGTSTITVAWDPTVPERSLKCKVKFKGKKTSLNMEAKLSVLEGKELISLNRSISCNTSNQTWTAGTTSSGCDPLGFNWYINGDFNSSTQTGTLTLPLSTASGLITAELDYGDCGYFPRLNRSLSIAQDRLEGPSTVSLSGSTFTIVPGELGGSNPTNLQWGCSISNGIQLTPSENRCIVDPSSTVGGMWGILFVSYTDACGIQRSLQKGFQVSASFGLNVTEPIDVAPSTLGHNEESNPSFSNKFELNNQTLSQQDFTFQSPINIGRELMLQVTATDVERRVILTSSVGSLIAQKELAPGDTFLNIPTFQLIPGFYFISIVAPNSATETKRLVVK
ncbi:MAG: hypothetical protein AB8F78_15745 [Saprospiraceae bacterium]